MRKDLPHAIYYSFWGCLWERREVGAGMALPCVWWCRPPRGLEAGSRAKGRKQLGGKKQVLKSSPSAVPQLSEWRVMQSRAGALFHHSVTQLQEGGGGASASLQPGGLAMHRLSSRSVHRRSETLPASLAAPVLWKAWKLQRDCLFSLPWKVEPVGRSCCFPE